MARTPGPAPVVVRGRRLELVVVGVAVPGPRGHRPRGPRPRHQRRGGPALRHQVQTLAPRPVDVEVIEVVEVRRGGAGDRVQVPALQPGELQPVEVGQQLLDLVRAVDVGHGVDPVPGGGAAHAHLGAHAEPAHAGAAARAQRGAVHGALGQGARHAAAARQSPRYSPIIVSPLHLQVNMEHFGKSQFFV